ncbi:trehalose-phosphatase-domain-containing protein [Mycena olivaceomarginata]|nr:trehalose-phosphatase-domain-containing protein [Mycena olivaceomarginata]
MRTALVPIRVTFHGRGVLADVCSLSPPLPASSLSAPHISLAHLPHPLPSFLPYISVSGLHLLPPFPALCSLSPPLPASSLSAPHISLAHLSLPLSLISPVHLCLWPPSVPTIPRLMFLVASSPRFISLCPAHLPRTSLSPSFPHFSRTSLSLASIRSHHSPPYVPCRLLSPLRLSPPTFASLPRLPAFPFLLSPLFPISPSPSLPSPALFGTISSLFLPDPPPGPAPHFIFSSLSSSPSLPRPFSPSPLQAFQKLLQTYPQWVGITPLQEGMNTTSMERLRDETIHTSLHAGSVSGYPTSGASFVEFHGRTKQSPVVPSEFMGISKHMEHALMVNPPIFALPLSIPILLSVALPYRSFFLSLFQKTDMSTDIRLQKTARRTSYVPRDVLESRYHSAKKRQFFFDYDGTLAPIVKTSSMAVPSAATLEALERLATDLRNVVYIISRHDGEFLEQHLGHLENVGYSAEHGGFMGEPEEDKWTTLTEKLGMMWWWRCSGIIHTERMTETVSRRYAAHAYTADFFECMQCQDLLENNLAHKRSIEVLVGKKNLEARPICIVLLYKNPDAEFVFSAHDDKVCLVSIISRPHLLTARRTDEDMFRTLILFGNGRHQGNDGATFERHALRRIDLAIKPEYVSTTVLAPQEIVEHMLGLVSGEALQSHPAHRSPYPEFHETLDLAPTFAGKRSHPHHHAQGCSCECKPHKAQTKPSAVTLENVFSQLFDGGHVEAKTTPEKTQAPAKVSKASLPRRPPPSRSRPLQLSATSYRVQEHAHTAFRARVDVLVLTTSTRNGGRVRDVRVEQHQHDAYVRYEASKAFLSSSVLSGGGGASE